VPAADLRERAVRDGRKESICVAGYILWVRTCSDCELELEETADRVPCPACGSTRQTIHVTATCAMGIGSAYATSVGIGYGPARPWQQKWRDVEQELAALEAVYAKDALSNELVRRQVDSFFDECRKVADWLKRNAGRAEAMEYVNTDFDLQLCDGMAQTDKHHTRTAGRDPDPITARVAWVYSGSGVRAEIEWSRKSGASGTVDALDLARRCTAAWKRFFQRHNLDPAI
jgi:predicted RNA-binding Zn-ribbon protein involved in translation (DUF1610 family)